MDPRELERAFLEHRARVADLTEDGAWGRYADEFTPDATYRRPGRDLLVGREAIREWVAQSMTTFPATEIASLDVLWYTVDTRREAVVYETRTTMTDPGDGSLLHASTTTSLGYAGDGLWGWAVDVTNVAAYAEMFASWVRTATRHGFVVPAGVPGVEPVADEDDDRDTRAS